MSIVYATVPKYGVSRDGTNFVYFPKNPNDYQVTSVLGDVGTPRVDRTKNLSKYWDMALLFNTMRPDEFNQVAGQFDPTLQKIYLCYYSGIVFGKGATGMADSSWVIGEAIWSQPPGVAKGEIRGRIVTQLTFKFDAVEWDGVIRRPWGA